MSFIHKLQKLLGKNNVHLDQPTIEEHSIDAWLFAHKPDAVVFAKSTETVSKVMKFAYQHHVPITVRGAGRGYVGGAVPAQGGIVLSVAKMNRILEINPIDGVAVVEPGVITGVLQEAVRKKGFFYPPDPASLKESSLGGNIATNAGGPRCVKYGVTRHFVLGLEVVLPTGEIIQIGSRTHKNKTGFDLVGLFTGSEGLLGTITKATLKIIPHPPARVCLSAGFKNEQCAAYAVQQILSHGFLPSALEIADRFTLEAARAYHAKQSKSKDTKKLFYVPNGGAHVLVELDGHKKSVIQEVHALSKLIRKLECVSLEIAETEEACQRLWDLRREFSYSLKATGLRKLNEDITIPRGKLVPLFDFTRKLQKKYGIPVAAFGHAGDGNIHVNLMVNSENEKRSEPALDELFTTILKWNGVITGEHGIGFAKKRWWPKAVSPRVHQLHLQLKRCLDPKELLNPGKFLGK